MRKLQASRPMSLAGAVGLTMTLGGLAACGDASPPIADGRPAAPPSVPTDPEKPAAELPPPPVSGGTLLVSSSDARVFAADPDRDSVWIIDAAKKQIKKRVTLSRGDEPGRLVEDADGKLHVALRRGGAIAKIDPESGQILGRRPVCAAPRGLAYDAATDNLHVACAGGELVTLKARGGDVVRSIVLDADLRDVVLKNDHLLVSRFRSAELLEVDASGTLVGRIKPRTATGTDIRDPMGRPSTSSPTTAWRLLPTSGGALMLHQRGLDGSISTRPGGYGAGNCKGSGIATTGLTLFSDATHSDAGIGDGGVLSMISMVVDVAVSRDGQQMALITPSPASAGNVVTGQTYGAVTSIARTAMGPKDPCVFPGTTVGTLTVAAELTAGAYDGAGRLWVQSRNPAQLHILATGQPSTVVNLDGAEDRASEGHRLFHTPTAGMIACASCHAEAGDDGHVWTFDSVGSRRTQTLRGGILATAPFHWDGDMTDLSKLMQDVFVGRMSGRSVTPSQVEAIGKWLDAQPPLPKAPRDAQAAARGKALFYDAKVACSSCHSGQHFTNNRNSDVGTGKAFQVPSLVDLAWRAPYMHTGCGKTLRDRFDPACGGGDKHGVTSHLSSGQIDDLVAYLETL